MYVGVGLDISDWCIVAFRNLAGFELAHTVPIDRILSVKNARAWVSMVAYVLSKLKC